MLQGDFSGVSPQFEYVIDCFNAISERRYRDAATILRENIDKQMTSSEALDLHEFMKHMGALMTYLEYKLEEDFPNDSDRKNERKIERRCSFCSKKQSEVTRLIAGPGVFVCDECVQICTKILVTDSAT